MRARIRKPLDGWLVVPNLGHQEQATSAFPIDDDRRSIAGRPGGAGGAPADPGAVAQRHATGRLAIDPRPEDACSATVGTSCVTGASRGNASPLALGATRLVDEADLDAASSTRPSHARRSAAGKPRRRRRARSTGRAPSRRRKTACLWLPCRHGCDAE